MLYATRNRAWGAMWQCWRPCHTLGPAVRAVRVTLHACVWPDCEPASGSSRLQCAGSRMRIISHTHASGPAIKAGGLGNQVRTRRATSALLYRPLRREARKAVEGSDQGRAHTQERERRGSKEAKQAAAAGASYTGRGRRVEIVCSQHWVRCCALRCCLTGSCSALK